jgi:hypothetical protein
MICYEIFGFVFEYVVYGCVFAAPACATQRTAFTMLAEELLTRKMRD